MNGHAEKIVSYNEDSTVTFESKKLIDILSKCHKRPLLIYAIAGVFGAGKSTLLNLFRLYTQYKQLNEDWRKHKDDVVEGKWYRFY